MGRSITTSLALLAVTGCGDEIGACDKQGDISGAWVFSLSGGDLPRSNAVSATLRQVRVPGAFGFGRYLHGRLVSGDKGFFDALAIPELTNNDGSKTGSMLGCALRVNVPIETEVSDDNADQGALRVSFAGTITARGRITGNPESSRLIMQGETLERWFTWTGAQ